MEDVKEWLAKVYAPLIHELKIEYIEEPIDREAKSKLYGLIGQDDLHPVYNTLQMGDGIHNKFIVQCTINGEELGRGTANNLKEAGLRAAMAGLNNNEVLKNTLWHANKLKNQLNYNDSKEKMPKEGGRRKIRTRKE